MKAKLATKLVLPADLPPRFVEDANRMLEISGTWERMAGIDTTQTVWSPPQRFLVIDGDLVGKTVVVSQQGGVLIVTGSIACDNLTVANNCSLVCAGGIEANGAVLTIAPDSSTRVAGSVEAKLVLSGDIAGNGAWLTLYDSKQLGDTQVAGYVMVGGRPHKGPKADLKALVVQAVIDERDWLDLAPEDREVEDIADFIRLDGKAAFAALTAGKPILV